MSKTWKNTHLKSWLQWKQRCALNLCTPEKQRDLGAWAQHKFSHAVEGKSKDYSMPEDRTLPDHEGRAGGKPRWNGWHFFETYMHATSEDTGKRWKDWLFEKAEREAREAVLGKKQEKLREALTEKLEANAHTCLSRTVVNRLLMDESDLKGKRKGIVTVSGDAPVTKSQDEENSFALFDSISLSRPEETPENQLALRQLEELAASLAQEYFKTLVRRARVGLAFSAEGFSLNAPEIVAAADCSSAKRIYEEINIEVPGKKRAEKMEKRGGAEKVVFLKKLGAMKDAEELKRVKGGLIFLKMAEEIMKGPYRNEDRRSVKLLIVECFHATVRLCIEWARKDERCAIIFSKKTGK